MTDSRRTLFQSVSMFFTETERYFFFQKHPKLINNLILKLESKITLFPTNLLKNEINTIWIGIGNTQIFFLTKNISSLQNEQIKYFILNFFPHALVIKNTHSGICVFHSHARTAELD